MNSWQSIASYIPNHLRINFLLTYVNDHDVKVCWQGALDIERMYPMLFEM